MQSDQYHYDYTANPAGCQSMTMPQNRHSEFKLLKVLSLLMDYPSNELFEDDTLAQCKQIVMASTLISPKVRGELISLIDDLLIIDPLEAQARYDGLFERGRSLSLWLFEHVHGESRDRGQAMVDLMSQYEQAGFEIGIKELPDYLPLYLEFLAYQAAVTDDDIQIRMDIADISHIIMLLAARLRDRDSLYTGCFHALLQITGKPLELVETCQKATSKEQRDDTKAALDKEWEEEVIDFLGAQQEKRCSTRTDTQEWAAESALVSQAPDSTRFNSTTHTDTPVHWVDFNQSSVLKRS